MILCHKCTGLLAYGESENIAGLRGCSCISGWVRGFEPYLNREQAIDAQINRTQERIAMYAQQGRSAQYLDPENKKLKELLQLKGEKS